MIFPIETRLLLQNYPARFNLCNEALELTFSECMQLRCLLDGVEKGLAKRSYHNIDARKFSPSVDHISSGADSTLIAKLEHRLALDVGEQTLKRREVALSCGQSPKLLNLQQHDGQITYIPYGIEVLFRLLTLSYLSLFHSLLSPYIQPTLLFTLGCRLSESY